MGQKMENAIQILHPPQMHCYGLVQPFLVWFYAQFYAGDLLEEAMELHLRF